MGLVQILLLFSSSVPPVFELSEELERRLLLPKDIFGCRRDLVTPQNEAFDMILGRNASLLYFRRPPIMFMATRPQQRIDAIVRRPQILLLAGLNTTVI